MENIVEIKNLNKNYKDFSLKNISFNIKEGTIVGLIGENGAGKTTTIKSILNIIKSSGEIQIFGKNINNSEKEIKEEIGVVLDDSFLSYYLTPKKVNMVMKDIYKKWSSKKFKEYLKIFNLPENKIINDFSSGMKMKLKIATAMAHSPKLLILDEPTSGLDPVVRNEILDIFRKYIEEDETRAILISTHITSDLENISDYIILIENGEIIFNKETGEILVNYGIVKTTKNEFAKIDKNNYISYKKGIYQYEVLVEDKEKFKNKYNGYVIDKPNLEEIMLFYNVILYRGKNK